MSAQGPAAAANPAAEAPAAPGFAGAVKQAALVWIGIQAVQYFVSGKKPFSSPTPPPPAGTPATAQTPDGVAPAGPAAPVQASTEPGTAAKQAPPQPLVPVWPPKAFLDISLKLSPEQDPLAVDLNDESYPGVTWTGVEWSNTKWSHVWETEWDVPEAVQHNGSFYLDAFVTRAGQSPVPGDETYPGAGEVLHVRRQLNRYNRQRRVRATKNLLTGKSDDDDEEEDEETEAEKNARPIVSFYHPNVTLELVCDSGAVNYAGLPPPVKQHVQVARDGARTYDGKQAYFPIVFPNTFWELSHQLNPLNASTTRLPLRVELKPTSHFKFQLLSTMDDAFTKQSTATGGGGGELDEIKRILIETNPLLLITTVVVSVLHMLFEFLAFTSDVKHWRNKKELVGVSVRTILVNVFTQTVVLLYLIDQSEETNYMIILSSGLGLAIEAWKITKAVDIRVVPHPSRPLLPYRIDIKDKHVLTEDELKTQEYDRLAFKWVAWGTTPFLIGWTIYSMLYQSHRSWYSFVIQTLTSFVQMFGFVQLVPQLIINYKLKSVAHIPIKAMGYKVLSTVIDDFFSFIIKMPLLHRLACFRDDVVFLILLYQMYIYRVDYSRENEYGQKLTDDEAKRLALDKDKARLGKEAEVEKSEVAGKGKKAVAESRKNK
ncbi:uncharacterized protein JCM10292_003152 [Rhodotorula paludigena]|uniref:uncharacterized protein n=1 Tax=Rhodotorula paludigena TaxID=86838 RepID=UPI0031815099